MKIAFIAHVFPRLHNTFILNEVVELIKLGHDVRIYSIKRAPEHVLNNDVQRFSLLQRTHYFEEFPLDSDEGVRAFDAYRQYFKEKIYFFRGVARHIAEENFDMLHGIFGNRPAEAAMILSELSGVPFSFEAHAFDLFVDFPFSQQKFAAAEFIQTESQYNRDYLIHSLGAPPEKVKVVHLAPNRDMLDEVKEKREDTLVVSACRLHPIKGLQFALQAIAALLPEFPNLKYVIAGDGEAGLELLGEARRLGLLDIVTFAGDMSNEDVARLIGRAAVFVLPCVISEDGDRDGTPTALAEAMYLGTPVVSSRISGIPELVDDRVNGILTEAGNVPQLIDALRTVLADKALRARMGSKGRDKIAREFDIRKSCNELLNLWQSIGTEPRESPIERPSILDLLRGTEVRATLGAGLQAKAIGVALGNRDPGLASLHRLPSETTKGERQLLFNFFSTFWQAEADVLEIGPFLGGTTRAIALGMLSNPKSRNGSRLVTVDRFGKYYDGVRLAEYMRPLFESGVLSARLQQELTANSELVDFLEIFDAIHREEPYFGVLDIRNQFLPDKREVAETAPLLFKLKPGEKFDSVFVDGCKTWYGTKYFMREVSSHVEPGCYFIFQDYGWFSCYWIPSFLAVFADLFELVAFCDYTYVFRLRKALQPHIVDEFFPDSAQDLSREFFQRVLALSLQEASDRADTRQMVFSNLQFAMALADLGFQDEAYAHAEFVRSQLIAQPYLDKIERAKQAVKDGSKP